MKRSTSELRPVPLQFALVAVFAFLAIAPLVAQSAGEGTGLPAQTPGTMPGTKDVPVQSAATISFAIRSAFGLNPSMVRLLQSRTAEAPGQAAAPSPQGSASSGVSGISWSDPLVRTVPLSVPVDVRLTGKNIVAQVQIMPLERQGDVVNLVIQGQVWVQMPDGSISFKSTLQTLSLPFGSRFYFYPLGASEKSGAPIAVEVRLDKTQQR